MSRRTLCLAAALTLSGCDPLEQDHSLTAPAEALSGIGKPASSGRVVRFQAGFFAFLNFDPSTGLQSVIGLPSDPTTSGVPFCNGNGDFEVLDWQTVAHSSGAVNTMIKAGEVNVHIYEAAAFIALLDQGDFCGAVSLPRLAGGQARLQYTDNDFDVSGSRANSFGWRIHGVLSDLVNGGEARYFDRLQGVLRPTGDFDFTATRVELTPLQ